MEKIIQKASDGGFNAKYGCDKGIEHFFLDPLFWQALGKSMGWKDNYSVDDPEWKTLTYAEMVERTPKRLYLSFMERNYMRGWSEAIEYLAEITK